MKFLFENIEITEDLDLYYQMITQVIFLSQEEEKMVQKMVMKLKLKLLKEVEKTLKE